MTTVATGPVPGLLTLACRLGRAAAAAGMPSVDGGPGRWPPHADAVATWIGNLVAVDPPSPELDANAPLNAADVARHRRDAARSWVHVVWTDRATADRFHDLAGNLEGVRQLAQADGDVWTLAADVPAEHVPTVIARLGGAR